MEETPTRSRTKKRAHTARPRRSTSSRSISSSSTTTTTTTSSSSSSSSRNRGRFKTEGLEECSVECTGQSCRACSATLVADCVALCCCPLAVVSLLALAFVKVPYVVGRRCLERRRRRDKEKRKVKEGGDRIGYNNGEIIPGMGRTRDIVFEFREGEMVEQRKSLCTGLIELDNVLLELYQVGHLGFGRVSFTGIQPNVKGI